MMGLGRKKHLFENETDAYFRDKNFRAVVPKVIADDDVETLVLQTGSIEITNINVNNAVKDPKKNIEEYKQKWFEKVERDSSNLFEVAEDALKNSTYLKKVIIIKRMPRFDPRKDDILGIKSQLSHYANTCYDQLHTFVKWNLRVEHQIWKYYKKARNQLSFVIPQ